MAGSSTQGQTEVDIASLSDHKEISREKKLTLYRAALRGDWKIAEGIFKESKEYITTKISGGGDTALHIAAVAKHTRFVEQLVNMMEKEESENDDKGYLKMKNDLGNTAFCYAAASGKVQLAKVMMEKNAELAMIPDSAERLPVHMAALFGHREMVRYLYQATKEKLDKKHRFQLLINLIKTDLYDVALKLLDEHSDIAVISPDVALKLLDEHSDLAAEKDEKDGKEETALHALARKPQEYSNFANENDQGIWKRCIKIFSGNNGVQNKTSVHQQAFELVERLWKQVISLDDKTAEGIGRQVITIAAEQGNVKFLTILINLYPDLIWSTYADVDYNKRTIFHIAVYHRHEDIFKLIYEIGLLKDLIVASKDGSNDTNMLHLAGLLAPLHRRNKVPGAALQLQRELLWFEEVKKIMQPLAAEERNNEGKTPGELFSEEHEGLMREGEKWMRDTANSCMIVAALIATVAFAAAFTVPGGNNDQTGIPIFLQRTSFKIFAMSDAISLLLSCTSILMFLSILTSRYTEKDFLWSLPTKLTIGLTTLLISIGAMMAAFSATFFIIFNQGRLEFAIAVAAIACLPVILFVVLHWRLFRDIIRSTYMSRFMFQTNQRTLFPKED